jgi:hypothetical protein
VLGESGGGAVVMGNSGENSGVVGLAHNPANYAAGIRGHHDGPDKGIGVYGSQAGAGWGGYFTSAGGIGVNTDGGTGIGVDAGGVTGVLARGRPGVASVGLQAIGATGVVAESNADTDGIGVSSTAFTSVIATGSNGSGGIGVTASGETAGMATGLTVGVQASGLTGIIATGSDAAVFGSISGGANGAAVHGLVNATSPGPDSAGVLGANAGTNGNGCGVRGAHAGGGAGGEFLSATGPGVVTQGAVGLRATGTRSGIQASTDSTSANAVAIRGEITSVSPPAGSAGVLGKNNGSGTASVGVRGVHAGTGNGVNGTSAGGRGGVFQGGAAQLRLQPSTHPTHPTAGLSGDLFLDSSKRLWLCVKGGSKAVWKQIQLK